MTAHQHRTRETMALTTRPLDSVGVEVSGFDINEPFSPELQEELDRKSVV